MPSLDPKATAETIRAEWNRRPPAPEPEQLHELKFLEEVCGYLGAPPNPFNLAHVARLMQKHDIGQHKPDQYPKMLTKPDDKGRPIVVVYPDEDTEGRAGLPVIFENEEEEAAYHGEGKPADAAVEDPADPNKQGATGDVG